MFSAMSAMNLPHSIVHGGEPTNSVLLIPELKINTNENDSTGSETHLFHRGMLGIDRFTRSKSRMPLVDGVVLNALIWRCTCLSFNELQA